MPDTTACDGGYTLYVRSYAPLESPGRGLESYTTAPSTALKGDSFPNAEMFYVDSVGTAHMLLALSTAGSRHFGLALYLPGNSRKPMTSLCITHRVGSNGYFL